MWVVVLGGGGGGFNESPETPLDPPMHGPLSTETPPGNGPFTMKCYKMNIIKQFHKIIIIIFLK